METLSIESCGVVFKFCRIYLLLVRTSVSAVLFLAMNSTRKNDCKRCSYSATILSRVNVHARRGVRVGKNSVRDACFRSCVKARNAE